MYPVELQTVQGKMNWANPPHVDREFFMPFECVGLDFTAVAPRPAAHGNRPS